ncbi:Beta-galactosidase C-terminal domain [Klebsiella variicola subsp. variicola]|nr:Beta-galactosidase C-terminal domain [Klebsiella variicola subsp. variicola]
MATARTDGESTFVFLQNYSAQSHTLTLPPGYRDCLTDAAAPDPLILSSMGLPYSSSPRVISSSPCLL